MRTYREPSEHLVDHLVQIALGLEHLAALRAEDTAAAAQLREQQAHHAAGLAARTEAARTAGMALPIEVVAHRFGLDRDDLALLVAAAVPGLDVGLAARWQALARTQEPERRVHELVELVAPAAGLAALGPARPLVQGRLVRLASSRDWAHEAPLLQRVVTVPECVVAALRGEPALDRAITMVASRRAPAPWADDRAVDAIRAALDGRGLVVTGAATVGKATAIATAAAAFGRSTLVARLDVVAAAGETPHWLDELACQARLLGDVLVLRAGDGFEALPLAMRHQVIAMVERGAAILTTRDADVVREIRAPRVIAVATPSAALQAQVWRAALGARELDAPAVAARCSLPVGEIIEAAATLGPAPTAEDAIDAARARLRHRLGEAASVVTTTLSWADLVVREDVSQRIFEVLAAVHYKQHVLDVWGFGDKLPYGRSISALLSGPPGTGKTMVATLIAKQLGLELFRVDLSKVVSKWLGETEKNLGKVFDEAARVGAVLLFDEADALFGKRTSVRSSNDRNANLEVNYLLQRLEHHDGVVLLTTNLAASIDEAFVRRLRYRIEFPRPEPAEREALWRSMIPARAPLASDVDLGAIAMRFDMAGGYIKNAVVRAAFLAAERGALAIDHDTLLHAAALEWSELGNLPT
ncbi:MAG: ATP-binding protein [Kofleriaceae bacterium]